MWLTVQLGWDPPPEPDLASYTLYHCNGPINDQAVCAGNMQKSTVFAAGANTYEHKIDVTGEQGSMHFRLSASDSVGNESPLSNEVMVEFDGVAPSPVTLNIILRLLKR
jgi:hypothetical protein